MTEAVQVLDLGTAEIIDIVERQYGYQPLMVTRLDSELSTVARIDLANGCMVFKAIPFSADDLRAAAWRAGAMQHLDEAGLPVGQTTIGRDGTLLGVVETDVGRVITQLSAWLPGVRLDATTPTPGLLWSVGDTAARISRALTAWPAPPVAIEHPWELIRTQSTLHAAMPSIADAATLRLVEEAAARFERTVAPELDSLPRMVVHHDLHDSNLLIDPATGVVSGVLDFGDMVVGPRVAELAVAAAYASRGSDDPVAGFLRVAEGWGRTAQLTAAEIGVVYDAGIARLAVNAAVWASRLHTARRDYALSRSEKSRAALAKLLAADPRIVLDQLTARL